MTTDRPYRAALPESEAIRRLKLSAGKPFDPAVVQTFVCLHKAGSIKRSEGALPRAGPGRRPPNRIALLVSAGTGGNVAKVGFCGLGSMGLPMASRLIQAGHDLTVWNRTAEKANPLLDRGAKLGGSPAEVAVHSEVVITMLATPQALDQVVFGPRGLSEVL